MDNQTIKNMGGSLSDLVKQGGDVAGSMTNAQIANSGAGAVSDYLKQNGGRNLAISGTPVTSDVHGTSYNGFTATASGNTSIVTYALVGSWPAGVSVNSSSGAVSGSLANNSIGSYAGLSVKATDKNGNSAKLPSFTLVVS